jgi:hypothetical protein
MGWTKGKPRKPAGIAAAVAQLRGAPDSGEDQGNGGGPGNPVDPATLDGRGGNVAAAPEKPAKDGKRPETRERPAVRRVKEADAELDASGIEKLLLAIHTGLGVVTSVPEFVLDPSEAAELSKASADVARHYKIPKFAQKTLDWTTLATVMASVYGTRIAAYRLRTADERAAARKTEADRRAAQNGGRPLQPAPKPPSPLNGGSPAPQPVKIEEADKTLDLRRFVPETTQ